MNAETASQPTSKPHSALQRPIAWYLRQLSRLMRVLSDEELDRLIPMLTERRFTPRELLFSAGDPAERVYLILKGRVKIFQVSQNGKEIIVDIVSRGGVVGDMAIVEDGERTASAQALEETVAVAITWEDFAHVVQQSPRLAFAMAEMMASRLVQMQRSFTSLVTKPVGARLADAILEREEDGRVRLGLTHQELGQVIGTSRETVTALLGRFTALGALQPVADGYVIVDRDILEAIADGDMQVSPRHPGVRAAEPGAVIS